MRLWDKNILLLYLLIFIGCGTAHQSDRPRTQMPMGSGNPYFEQGNIYLKNKQYHRAIEQYQQALRLEPDAAIIHASLGWAYYNVGMLDAAIAEGEAVMRLEPNHPDVPKLMELLRQIRKQRAR